MKNTAQDMGMRIPDGYEIDWMTMNGKTWYEVTGLAEGGGILDEAFAVIVWGDRRGNYGIELGASVVGQFCGKPQLTPRACVCGGDA